MDPIDETVVQLADLQELADKAANYERLERLLRRYVSEHAARYERDQVCTCAWCSEARDLFV